MTQTLEIAHAEAPELQRWLAEQPCQFCRAKDEGIPHQGCQGTGLAFPWASSGEGCPFCGGASRPPPEGDNSPCEDCDDTGRVPKAVGLDTILNELRKMGAVFDIGPGRFHLVGTETPKHRWQWETEEELTLAALRAVCASVMR